MDTQASHIELLADLFDRHAAALELYAAQWTATPADCVQEAYIRLASLLQQAGTTPQNPTAWLYRVVRNQAHNAARAQRRREYHEQIAARLTPREALDNWQRGDQQALLTAIDALTDAERELVILRIWSELTWQEIAELTETSSSSAQRNYVAVLRELRKQLEPSCLPIPD